MDKFKPGDRVRIGTGFKGTVLGSDEDQSGRLHIAVRLDDYESRYRSDELYVEQNKFGPFTRDHHCIESWDDLEVISE